GGQSWPACPDARAQARRADRGEAAGGPVRRHRDARSARQAPYSRRCGRRALFDDAAGGQRRDADRAAILPLGQSRARLDAGVDRRRRRIDAHSAGGGLKMSAPSARRAKIAIIGDRFLSPHMFEASIRTRCMGPLDIATMELPWPDEPMRHGYAEPGMGGLKEYQGDAEAIVGFIGDAEIAITQLAPFSAAMMKRMPGLKLIVAARGGPVNIDLAAARERNIVVVNAPGRNASAVAEFTIGA